MLKLLVALPLLAFAALCLALLLAQRSILFPAHQVGPSPPLPARAERLSLVAGDGVRLEGVLLAPARPGDAGAPAILGFAGNAWNAGDAALYLATIFADRPVALFHYRGYRPSGGSASARALLADAEQVRERTGRPLVAVGFSIGSGVAAHLAARRPLAGAILVTPFDSLHAVARGHLRWLPTSWLLRHRMDAGAALAQTEVPVAIVAAGGDTLIPPERAQALAGQTRNLVFQRTIAAGHNDIYGRADCEAPLREALARIEAQPPPVAGAAVAP